MHQLNFIARHFNFVLTRSMIKDVKLFIEVDNLAIFMALLYVHCRQSRLLSLTFMTVNVVLYKVLFLDGTLLILPLRYVG